MFTAVLFLQLCLRGQLDSLCYDSWITLLEHSSKTMFEGDSWIAVGLFNQYYLSFFIFSSNYVFSFKYLLLFIGAYIQLQWLNKFLPFFFTINWVSVLFIGFFFLQCACCAHFIQLTPFIRLFIFLCAGFVCIFCFFF